MEKQLHKSVVGYFLHLSKINEKWNVLVQSAERPLNNLKNQEEQLRMVSDCSLDNADLFSIDSTLRGKLIFKINVCMEDEIALISEIDSQLNNLVQGLRNKFTLLEAARSEVNINAEEMEELVSGSPYRPGLDLLMKWAIDSTNYYSELYSFINASLRSLDCKKEKTIVNLITAFEQHKNTQAKIDGILGFTQFVAKEIE
ncbi:uncharacterized protein [Neodiprion pinetum]|uniref:uncharacterized protein isoform X2 n=1 Tax=Neodiprion pinetum TaxID=441929 RepID=UPI001EDDE2A5|nr:uncharacterized protein LOC124213003 isoform X1 [Neodiprion pinetum]